jgi:type II secretory pathway component GspD/PulD (secretin)
MKTQNPVHIMKVIQVLILVAAFSPLCSMGAPEPADTTTTKPTAEQAPAQAVVAPDKPENTSVAPVTQVNGTNGLRMNFRGASLEMVLNYLSEAAGFIINVKPGTSVRGKVDIWSNETLTREEALELLDTVLNQNSLAAIRNGKVLSIVNRDEAKTQNVPVIQEADPNKIPSTDRIVTQIIPVRFVEVAQLVKDLQPLLSVQTTITANEAGNSLVITDTQANIKKVAEVVRAIDLGAEDVGVVKVFHLQHADPNETADLLTNLFPDDSRTGGSQGSQFGGRFGGFGGFFGRGGGGGGGFGGGGGGGNQGGNSNSQNQRLRKRNRVVAVADPRTSSVVVTSSRDLMAQIEGVIEDLDSDAANQQGIAIFHMQNAQPQEALQVFQDIFNKNNQQNNRNNTANQTSPLTGRSTAQNQQNNNNSSRTSTMNGNSRGIGAGSSFGQ